MSRLFLTLYALIAVALGGYYVATITVPDYFLKPISLEYANDNYRGTIFLLNLKIAGLDEAQRTSAVDAIKNQFEYPIDLVPASTLNLTDSERARFDQNLLVERRIDEAGRGLFRSAVPGFIWVFDTEQTPSEHYRRLTIGTFRLIGDRLRGEPAPRRAEILTGLNDHFGFPLALVSLSDARLSEANKLAIDAGGVVGVNVDTDDERYYYRLPDLLSPQNSPVTDVLRFGPIDFPLNVPLIVSLLIAMLAIFIAIAVLVWIRPVWSNLISLGDATRRFGAGDLSARVEVQKRSGIAEASKAFNTMAERIQNLIGSHKELTNAVSHELRTPLSRLRFNIELAENTDSASDQRRYLANMSEDISELDTLINEMLTYARFDRDASQIRREPLAILPWLQEEYERLSRNDENNLIHLEIARELEDLQVLAESRLLARALTNLVQNSLRYARKVVMIRVLSAPGGIAICVDDDGPGIPQEAHDSVFDAFARLDQSRNRSSGGFGLGLSIVKQIVEWHGGTITICDAPEGGARFRMFIPS